MEYCKSINAILFEQILIASELRWHLEIVLHTYC